MNLQAMVKHIEIWLIDKLIPYGAAAVLMKELRQPASAVLVWNGASRGDAYITGDFGIEAKRRGLPVLEVLTL